MTKQTSISTQKQLESNIKKIENIYLFIYLFISLVNSSFFSVVFFSGNVGVSFA